MGTPFKMKGSPMQRNFGIGSPLHQDINPQKYIKLTNKLRRAKGGKVSYESAWQGMSSKEQGKHKSFEGFKTAAKKWNKENPDYNKAMHGRKGGPIL